MHYFIFSGIKKKSNYVVSEHRWARVLGQGGCVHTGCVRKKFCGRLWWPQHMGVNFWEYFHPGVSGCAQGCEF